MATVTAGSVYGININGQLVYSGPGGVIAINMNIINAYEQEKYFLQLQKTVSGPEWITFIFRIPQSGVISLPGGQYYNIRLRGYYGPTATGPWTLLAEDAQSTIYRI